MQSLKGWFTILGFLLLMMGVLSIVFSMIGLRFSFLAFLDAPGELFSFIVKLIMTFSGVIIIALARTNWEQENDPEISKNPVDNE